MMQKNSHAREVRMYHQKETKGTRYQTDYSPINEAEEFFLTKVLETWRVCEMNKHQGNSSSGLKWN